MRSLECLFRNWSVVDQYIVLVNRILKILQVIGRSTNLKFQLTKSSCNCVSTTTFHFLLHFNSSHFSQKLLRSSHIGQPKGDSKVRKVKDRQNLIFHLPTEGIIFFSTSSLSLSSLWSPRSQTSYLFLKCFQKCLWKGWQRGQKHLVRGRVLILLETYRVRLRWSWNQWAILP